MIAGYFGISNSGLCKRRLAAARVAVEVAVHKSLSTAQPALAACRRAEERPAREKN